MVPASAANEASLVMRLASPLETSSCAAQTAPTPHSASSCGASSVTSLSSERSISPISCERLWARFAMRRSTSQRPSELDRSLVAVLTSRALESPVRRSRSASGAVTTSAWSWLSAAVRAWMAPRRSTSSTRSCSRCPPPRGVLNPSPESRRRAASAASMKSFLPRLRSPRRGRSHSHTRQPLVSRKRARPAP